MKNHTATVEVNGSRLKVEREAQGLSLKDLALRVCLSHQHIAQLENNQSVIFFTTAHKIQVAKKVGKVLGLEESEYIKFQVPSEDNASSSAIKVEPESEIQLPISNDLFAKANVKLSPNQKNILIKPFLLLSSLVILSSLVVFSYGYSSFNLMELVETLLTPTPKTPVIVKSVDSPSIENFTTDLPSTTTPEVAELKKVALNNEQSLCSYPTQGVSVYRTTNPSKSAEMVYILSRDHQSVCIIDNQNKSFPLDLDAGQSRSIYGQAPFTVVSSNLSKFDIYFQGWKVKVPDAETTSIRLVPTELVQN